MNKWECNGCGADVREQIKFVRFQGITFCSKECLLEELMLSSELELCVTEFEDFDDEEN